MQLADSSFGQPGKIDILLGLDVFVNVFLHGRQFGPPGSPVAFETKFGWVLAGESNAAVPANHDITYHASILSDDDVLKKF